MNLVLNDKTEKYNQILNIIYDYKIKYKNFPTYFNSNLYISKSKINGAGRGVFTKKNLKKNTILEIFPTIPIVGDIGENTRYTYGSTVIGGGLTPFYNSALKNEDANIGSHILSLPGFNYSLIAIQTIKDVKANGELYLYYYGKSFEAGYEIGLIKEV